MKEEKINKLVEETLAIPEGIKPADVSHIQTNNILSAILEQASLKLKPEIINLKFAYPIAAGICIIFSLNIFTYLHFNHFKKNQSQETLSNYYYNNSINNITNLLETNNE
jgi:hypothetical protein